MGGNRTVQTLRRWQEIMTRCFIHMHHVVRSARNQTRHQLRQLELIRQQQQISTDMLAGITMFASRLGYLTPMRDHVNAVANVMYGLPPSQPPPPRSQQRAEDEYEETRRFRDRCHHENKRTYYAQGRWLFCDNCKRRWRAVETADTSAWVIDDRDDTRRKPVFSGKSRASSWQSAPPASGSRTTTPTFPPSSTSGFGACPKRGSRTAPSHVPPPHQEPDAWDVTNDMSGSLSETYSEELEERNDSEA